MHFIMIATCFYVVAYDLMLRSYKPTIIGTGLAVFSAAMFLQESCHRYQVNLKLNPDAPFLRDVLTRPSAVAMLAGFVVCVWCCSWLLPKTGDLCTRGSPFARTRFCRCSRPSSFISSPKEPP